MYKYNADILPSSVDNFFQNCTAYMIMAKDSKFQEIFIINLLELIMVKKMLQYVGPVAWGCSSNMIKTLPLHMFSYWIKSCLLAGY